MAPCILFFDEFDSLGADRGKIGSGFSGLSSVVNQILTEMDGIDSRDGVLVIAATNRMDLIDQAFLREGRLGTHIEVSLPSREEYAGILRVHLGSVPMSDEIDLEELSSSLPLGLSGADISGIAISIKEGSVKRHLDQNSDGNIDGFRVEQEDAASAIEAMSQGIQMAGWA